ncbi:MAG TPA: UDP-glucose 4-epimerase GalE [Bdellovibrionales bacterium]|nr:UDP-glucose 4-epimerase GalE [Bdellovibrionales bacterium]
MKILVTGAAGYIGSHAVKRLLAMNHEVVALDNLCHGHRQAVDARAKFVELDVADRESLTRLLRDERIEAVMHFAAFIEVAESVANPGKYYFNNFANGLTLLEAMKTAGVSQLVFSSTAAVYGNPERTPIPEDHPRNPINPYGRSKMMMEMAIEDFTKAHGLAAVVLRYFNVAGASSDGSIGEAHEPESHLIPRILAAAQGDSPSAGIFGTDYPTRDGTCIRDYIHVEDLASAHERALHLMKPGQLLVFNLGSENGFTVKEVIEACKSVTGKSFDVQVQGRRPGDPAILVASNAAAKSRLGWTLKYPELKTIVQHAWAWQQNGLRRWLGKT